MFRFFFDFIERFRLQYPEVYGGGTNEGSTALDYFVKWGFYASLFELGNGDLFEIRKLGKANIHEIHVVLACKKDTMKLKHKIQTGNKNTIDL